MKEKNEELIIDLDELTRKIYNKIALWNNDDRQSDEEKGIALKSISYEIAQMVLTDAFANLEEIKTGVKTFKGRKKKKKSFYENFFPNKDSK